AGGAARARRRADRALRQGGRTRERHRRRRLRFRHLRRLEGGASKHRLGEIRIAGRRRAYRQPRAVAELTLPNLTTRANPGSLDDNPPFFYRLATSPRSNGVIRRTVTRRFSRLGPSVAIFRCWAP